MSKTSIFMAGFVAALLVTKALEVMAPAPATAAIAPTQCDQPHQVTEVQRIMAMMRLPILASEPELDEVGNLIRSVGNE